jgi:peptidoglycan/LPS O-acetylase OafA/YrhL
MLIFLSPLPALSGDVCLSRQEIYRCLHGQYEQSGCAGVHGWVDFIYYLLFFIIGYIILSDEQITQAVRRDWRIHLILGIFCTLFIFSVAFGVPVYDWMGARSTPMFFVTWLLWGVNSWCWTMVMFYIGMRHLNFSNQWLQYSREATYPFFFFHQPVIVAVSFYVVQWDVNLLAKLFVVVFGSFCMSIGIYELLVRRIKVIRALFGMKPK